jgi:hypothetical protein
LGNGEQGRKDFLLFGGGSAGARGAMVHLDYVPEMLGEATDHVEVVGFLDSPLWLDIEPLNATEFGGFANQTATVHSVVNARNLDDDCVAAYPEDQWKCMLGEYRMPFVETRYLMVASLHDGFQLWYDAQWPDWTNPSEAQQEYARRFAIRTRDSLHNLASRGHAVIGQACNNHAESLSDLGYFAHRTEDGSTMNHALHRFLGLDGSNGSNRTLKWVDQCDDLDCGTGCHFGDCEGRHATDPHCEVDLPDTGPMLQNMALLTSTVAQMHTAFRDQIQQMVDRLDQVRQFLESRMSEDGAETGRSAEPAENTSEPMLQHMAALTSTVAQMNTTFRDQLQQMDDNVTQVRRFLDSLISAEALEAQLSVAHRGARPLLGAAVCVVAAALLAASARAGA